MSDLVNICYSRLFQNIYVSPLPIPTLLSPILIHTLQELEGLWEDKKVSGWRPRVQNVQGEENIQPTIPLWRIQKESQWEDTW